MGKKRGSVPIGPGNGPGSGATGKGNDDGQISDIWWRHWDVTVTSAATIAGPVETERFDPLATRKLTRAADLAAFDKEATDLILEMQEHGWRGFITARGHAMMRHPDGSTQSITRSSNRAKSGTAMRSRFLSWQRHKERARAAAAGASFGAASDEPVSMDLPVALLADIKRHPVCGPLMVSQELPDKATAMVVDEDPKSWALFRVDGPYPVLLGIGTHATEERSWELLLMNNPEAFPAPAQVSQSQDEAGDDMATVFKCPQCEATFETHAKARSHETHKHNATPATCPVCGREFKNRGAVNLHHSVKHDNAEYVCDIDGCGRTFIGKGTLHQHKKLSHRAPASEVAGDVTVAGHPVVAPAVDGVTEMDVTVTSPEPPATSGAHDVVMDHLEHLPEGDDAEAMIAAVRAIIAAPLVAEIKRLRGEAETVDREMKRLTERNGELEAKLSIMREAFAL